jgi:hypothetical protein
MLRRWASSGTVPETPFSCKVSATKTLFFAAASAMAWPCRFSEAPLTLVMLDVRSKPKAAAGRFIAAKGSTVWGVGPGLAIIAACNRTRCPVVLPTFCGARRAPPNAERTRSQKRGSNRATSAPLPCAHVLYRGASKPERPVLNLCHFSGPAPGGSGGESRLPFSLEDRKCGPVSARIRGGV